MWRTEQEQEHQTVAPQSRIGALRHSAIVRTDGWEFVGMASTPPSLPHSVNDANACVRNWKLSRPTGPRRPASSSSSSLSVCQITCLWPCLSKGFTPAVPKLLEENPMSSDGRSRRRELVEEAYRLQVKAGLMARHIPLTEPT